METIETFRPKYQAFLDSNLTARDFCKQTGMAESHFFYWQAKIRKESAKSTGDFLPVSLNNHSGKVIMIGGKQMKSTFTQSIQPAYEITYPNGVTVRLSGEISATTLGQLIMLGR